MYVEIDQGLKTAIKEACKSQIIANDFMILCELYKLGEVSKTEFEKQLKERRIHHGAYL